MSFRQRMWTAAAACQLSLVVLGASSIRWPDQAGPVARILNWYGAVSGADNGYGFFSPNVGMPVRVRFLLFDKSGRSWSDELYEGNNEVDLRLTAGYLATDDREVRQRLLASWAAKLFARHPSARRILVQIDWYNLPTMECYTAGERPSWQPEYEAEFKRSESVPE